MLFLRAWPRDAAGGEVALRLAGGGAASAFVHAGEHYRAGLVGRPTFSAALSFGDNGWSGGTIPASAALGFAPSDTALRDQLLSLSWRGARLEIDAGDDGSVPVRLLTGTVADMVYKDGQFTISVADLSKGYDKKIVGAAFAGTGGIEGFAGAAGRIKRRSWGQVFNVEGRLLDAVNNIYEFGDPAYPLQGMTALRDKGREGATTTVAWAGSIAATLAALQASVPAQGGGVVAPSIACAKWWTQPSGPLTADLLGEIGAGYIETAPAIASRLVTLAGGTVITNLAAAVGWRGGAAGLHVDGESETWSSAIDRLLLGVSLLWVLGPAGAVEIRQWSFSDPAEGLQALFIERERSIPPTSSRSVGYKANNRVHSEAEISAALLTSDITGLGDLAVQDVVDLDTQVTGKSLAVLDGGAAAHLATIQPGAQVNPANLAALDAAASDKLSGIQPGAQVNPANLAALDAAANTKLTGIEAGATAGDNIIRNAALASTASDWVVTLGTALRTVSAVAGDLPAYMRATGTANLIALNNQEKIAVRPGARLHYSFSARADVQSSASGVGMRRVYVRQTFYNAANANILIVDTWDTTKASVNNVPGGVAASWELHTCYYDVPANAVSVKIEMFPLLGASGGGLYVDVARVVMGVAQAGADKTDAQLRDQQIARAATAGDNLLRNGDFASSADNWMTSNATWGANNLAWSNASAGDMRGYLRWTGVSGVSSAYAPVRYDRSSPNHVDDMIPVIAGKDYYLSFAYRSDGAKTITADLWFYTAAGVLVSAGVATTLGALAANTSGAWVRSAIGRVTAPTGVARAFLRVTFQHTSGSYVDITEVRLAAVEVGATVGAVAGLNIKDSAGAVLADSAIKNSAISIAANGIISGAGGGQVTIGGLGYTGALNATYGADLAANVTNKSLANLDAAASGKLGGIEAGADVTATAQVIVTMPVAQTIYRDWQGAVKEGQLPRTLTPAVMRGGVDVRTNASTTYALAATGGLAGKASVNNTAGSADKGRIDLPATITSGGTLTLTVSWAGVEVGAFPLAVSTSDDAPPANNGASGGTDPSLATVTSTADVVMTGVTSGEASTLMDVTIAAGQTIKGTLNASYTKSGALTGSNAMMVKWQYSADAVTWTDFVAGTYVTGTAAYFDAETFESEPGDITCIQTIAGLAAGTWHIRAVGKKQTGTSGSLVIATGSATSSIA